MLAARKRFFARFARCRTATPPLNGGAQHYPAVTSKALHEIVEQPLINRCIRDQGDAPWLAVRAVLADRRTKLLDESTRGLHIAIARRIDPERELITPTVSAHCALTQSPFGEAAPAG
ncbi:hypothetical protein CO709_24890 [Burkholderia thailandensis]|nr:hypothetical protein CO709_24890 [Burkholderia thailandensis]KST73629.1 hypothetical protein WS76_05225 [Burkholderia humptydooensis]